MCIATLVTFLAVAVQAQAGDRTLVLDAFDYPNADAARKAWVQRDNHPPVEVVEVADRGSALKIPLPFQSLETDRSYVDRGVALDLSGYGEVSIDVFGSDPNPAARVTLYFRSGAGWYGRSLGLRKGWHTVALSKGDFGTEDTPTGWHAIDAIRISPWKGQAIDGYCLVDNLRVRAHEFAVVAGAAAVAKRHSESRTVTEYAGKMVAMLRDAGLSAGSIDDFDVTRGALEHARVALFPYNPVLADGEVEAVKQFVEAGGKVVVFYSLHEGMAELLGVKQVGWEKQTRPGHFAEIRFDARGITGLPSSVKQRSWNVTLAEPVAHNAKVIGRWFDDEGADVGKPAVLMSDTGVFMSHVLLTDDAAHKRQMLLAWLGTYAPDLWPKAAARAIAEAGGAGPLESLADLETFVGERTRSHPQGGRAQAALAETDRLLKRAAALAEAGEYTKAIETASQASTSAGQAYALCHRARTCEFRALWNHSGLGAFAGDWDQSMANLKKGGFNAIVPNMWWAGRAHYKSEYLPLSETYKKYGDQIEQCVAAGKRHGIEVHPWKVNWNLSGAPKSFVDQLRDEGRLQVHIGGTGRPWLCPSHPKNFELELKTMVEVAEKYDVDGVHFDYIRYPNGNACYCDGCRERFEAQIGEKVAHWPQDAHTGPLRKQYRNFRCAQITRLVKATAESVRAIKPHCKISAAVFSSYPNCRDGVGQDWVLWCREGWLDFVCPMNYIQQDEVFAQRVATQLGQVAGSVPLYSGVGVTLRWTHTPEEAISQIDLARRAGADGIIVFNYSDRLAGRFMDALGAGIFSEPAILPHHAAEVEFRIPGKPHAASHVLIVEGDACDASATVTSLGRHRKKAVGVRARLRLEDTAGRVIEEYGAVSAAGQTVAGRVGKRDGWVRLAVAGTLVFDDGAEQPFVARSYPFAFGQ